MTSIAYATKTGGRRGDHADGDAPEPGELALKLRWVRGIESKLDDLVIRGQKFTDHFGDSLLEGTLVRKIVGASELKISVSDPFRKLLNKPIVAEQHELELDGLHWLLVKVSGEGLGQPLTLTYEPRVVAELKKIMGPVRGKRESMTRAEFAKKLTELLPKGRQPRFISPLLHVKQPIKTEKQAQKAASTSSAERKKGLDHTGLTCKGETPTTEQFELGEMALAIAESHGASSAVMQMVIMALIDETDMGLVQRGNVLAALEPYTQVRNAAEEIAAFVSGEPTWTGTSAMKEYAAAPNEKLSVLVQRVQKSATADGSNYAAFEAESAKWVENWGGGVDSSTTSETITKKYEFAVAKKESAWKAMVRLAGEVNWRCFESAGWIYFIDEIELLKQKSIMHLTPFAPELEDITYDHDEGKETDELSVTAWAKAWEAPPGTMVSVGGLGPNDGIYLVSQIEAPLARKESSVQITLKRPHKPLAEPAATTEVKSLGGSSGTNAAEAPASVQRVLAFCEEEAERAPPYIWGGTTPAGYDCSGFVSAALEAGGLLGEHLTTVGLATYGEAGKGDWITIYDHALFGDAHAEHVIIEVAGRFFASGEGSESGGAGKVKDSINTAAWLAHFEHVRHPVGL